MPLLALATCTVTSHQQTLKEVTFLVTDHGTRLLLHSNLWTEELTVKDDCFQVNILWQLNLGLC